MLYLDLETYNEADLRLVGAYKYATTAEVLICAYAIDDAPATAWDVTLGDPMPEELRQSLSDPSVTVVMHNGAMFDRLVLKHAMGIDIPINRIIDTMVQARAHSLPGALSDLCTAFNIPEEYSKHAEGSRLVQRFCKPQPARSTVRRATRDTHAAEWGRFMAYAVNDIVAMREVYKRMPRWNYPGLESEARLFELDQAINDRGFAIDVELAVAASGMIQRELERLDAEIATLSGGEVQTTNQLAALTRHLRNRFDLDIPSLTKADVEEILARPDLPEAARQLLRIRQQANATSVTKFNRLLQTMSSDNRLRGVLAFCGAARTGRWSSKLFQVQNLARPSRSAQEVEAGIEAIKSGAADLIYSDLIGLAKDVVRGVIVAGPGKKLVVADLAGIESRVVSWLANEQWKVDAFAQYDAGQGTDSYCSAYGRLFNVDPATVTKDQRQTGKVLELSMSYGGGPGAFVNMASVYGLDVEQLGETAAPLIPDDVLANSANWYAKVEPERRMEGVISPHAWIVCDALKVMWRHAHPGIAGLWKRFDEAVIEACANPDVPVAVGKLTVCKQGNWLTVMLPSGRRLCYPGIRVTEDGASYMGSVSQAGGKWQRIESYGGKWLENVTQSVARDILAHGMMLAEKAGYAIISTVHDEIIAEVPDSPEFSAEGLATLMATNPTWAKGLPLAAEGFDSNRYRK
jgi:DNA polymerase